MWWWWRQCWHSQWVRSALPMRIQLKRRVGRNTANKNTTHRCQDQSQTFSPKTVRDVTHRTIRRREMVTFTCNVIVIHSPTHRHAFQFTHTHTHTHKHKHPQTHFLTLSLFHPHSFSLSLSLLPSLSYVLPRHEAHWEMEKTITTTQQTMLFQYYLRTIKASRRKHWLAAKLERNETPLPVLPV